MMKQKRDFKLTAIDIPTETHGFMIVPNKKMTKEAVYKAMEDMRFICRARNIDEMFGFATNIYEWQIVYYSRAMEM